MANRYIVMGQLFVTNVTSGVSVTGRVVADTAFTCVGAGTFTVDMANGTTGSISGTNVQGSPVALSAGLNTITTTGAVADGQIDITIGTAANTNSVNTYSAASGGACGASIPTSADNLYGDSNSFTAGSQVLTVNAVLTCLDLDFTGSLFSPTFTGSQTSYIYGSLTYIAAMSLSYSGIMVFSATANKYITTSGQTILGSAIFNGAAGQWTLQDDFYAPSQTIYLQNGTLVTNNKTVTMGYLEIIAGTKTLTLGSSTWNCTYWVVTAPANFILTANTATINCSVNAVLGDIDYNGATFVLTGATSTVSGSPTGLAAFNLTPGTTQAITFTAGQNITADDFTLDGSAGHIHTLTSTGAYTLTKSGGGTVSADYLSLTYCQGAPASTFYRKANVTYGVGNSGWTPYQSSDMRLVDTAPLEACRRRITSGVA